MKRQRRKQGKQNRGCVPNYRPIIEWEYIVGIQLGRAREKGEVSLEERIIIDQHTPPEIWLNKKGTQGWELVSILHRRDYTEFFMKRRTDTVETLSSDTIEKEAIKLCTSPN